ncbi:MAG: anthranilate phosphoribosyltransferase [Desulfobacterales bacterium]|nr:MAG: anthranilate phosphoribosyltransferase [Desulfobacterales bacterium]
MIKEAIKKVVIGQDLSEASMEETMLEVLEGKATASQVGSFVTALRMKGETIEELTGAAKALRNKVVTLDVNNNLINLDRDDINVEDETILATSESMETGTNTFNVSTATIFVVAGGGIKVVRQGNWARSRYFGAADVLENLGIKLDISRTDVEKCIEEVGIGFLFAPLFHGIMRHVEGIRAEMGIRTIFNLSAPLANPANSSAHVLGVYDSLLTEKMAQVLKNLGATQAFVVYGEGTFDEISICGPTQISYLKNGDVESFQLKPEDYGFKKADRKDLAGGDAQKNSRIIHAILDGEPGPKRDMVVLNAAAAFVAAGLDSNLKDGIKRAEHAIDSGAAKEKLDALARFTSSCGIFARAL